MQPTLTIGDATIYLGNNLDVLPTLADNSVDSIVCDPPYELGFMGKSWDSSGIAYSVELWQECLRVLKPGGHLLAFGGTRTWHRLAVAIEDAGFEIRDNIAWLYGSGFPKSHNISKAIDKAAGAEREVVGHRNPSGSGVAGNAEKDNSGSHIWSGELRSNEPITDDAKAWDGWGTALKPAHEPIVVARKPLIGTVAENVLQFGTGGLNIDATRIKFAEDDKPSAGNRTATFGTQETKSGGDGSGGYEANTVGRWPANIILDEYTAELLDEQSGISKSTGGRIGKKDASNINFGLSGKYEKGDPGFGDVGGASRYFKVIKEKENNGTDNQTTEKGNQRPRLFATNGGRVELSHGIGESFGNSSNFFYVAKANKRDRNEGLDELPEVRHADRNNSDGVGGDNPRNRTNQAKQNFHPTVKPTSLMQYLIRLVTPEGGIVLDPFAGSGSTGKAALLENKRFIGIELTAEYLPIIEGRLKHANETRLSKGDDLFE